MRVSITRLYPDPGGDILGHGSEVDGDIRMYPPMEGDFMLLENPNMPGGGIVTSRVEYVAAVVDSRDMVVSTVNSIYRITPLGDEDDVN